MLIQREFDSILRLEVPADELGLQIRLLLTAKHGADEAGVDVVDEFLARVYSEIQSQEQ